ncbi:MAG: DEAD/DEAH box helicase [Candidatus Melainabacteria bacterium]|nr:DEAD/DEAH box helicase [Candidatus Melainabacteria bacterium]
MNFKAINLSELTLNGLRDMGFQSMTPVQEKAIPLMLKMKDITVQAETGTGKTAAFAIPVIERIIKETVDIQALVLCPTRELTIQVAEHFNLLLKYHENIACMAIYGGQSMNAQLKTLKTQPRIIVATPGRLLDHIKQGTVKLRAVKTLILDEADKMLEMGFKDDIEAILHATKNREQTALFSATMPQEIVRLAHKHQKKPEFLNLVKKKVIEIKIDQKYFETKAEQKIELIKRLLFAYRLRSVMIFCNTRVQVDKLYYTLKDEGFSVANLHGDLKQNKRDAVMRKFREGEAQILIATDIAARGIDVDDIEAVINYNLPRDSEDYVHRIGRTARAGKSGYAFSVVTPLEVKFLREICEKQKLSVTRSAVPGVNSIDLGSVEMIKNTLIDSSLTKKTSKKFLKMMKDLEAEGFIGEDLKEEIIKKLLNTKTSVFGAGLN